MTETAREWKIVAFFGRFGEGFLIDRESYERDGWAEIMPFEVARHPFSGYSPFDIFAEALREFQLRPFLKRAIKAAAEGRKL